MKIKKRIKKRRKRSRGRRWTVVSPRTVRASIRDFLSVVLTACITGIIWGQECRQVKLTAGVKPRKDLEHRRKKCTITRISAKEVHYTYNIWSFYLDRWRQWRQEMTQYFISTKCFMLIYIVYGDYTYGILYIWCIIYHFHSLHRIKHYKKLVNVRLKGNLSSIQDVIKISFASIWVSVKELQNISYRVCFKMKIELNIYIEEFNLIVYSKKSWFHSNFTQISLQK